MASKKSDKLEIVPSGIEIRQSSTDGYGVYATRSFKEGEVVESCVVIKDVINPEFVMVQNPHQQTAFIDIINHRCLPNYRFIGHVDANGGLKFWIVLSGYAMLYNSCPEGTTHNVKTNPITQDRIIKITAVKKINKGDELLMHYNTANMKRHKSRLEHERNRNNKS